MEWSDKENRIAVIALHKVGMEPSKIFKSLQRLGISQMFVYRTINRFAETSEYSTLQEVGAYKSSC